MSGQKWWQTEENDEVATKPELWRPLKRSMGGFDLDPAAGCEPTPIADNRYTETDDGLTQRWYGSVWLNPPFSDKHAFLKKLVDSYWNGDVDAAVCIVPGGVDTNWFHNHFATADVIGFLDGRDWYIHGNSTPNFSTMAGVWNPTQDVIDTLQTLGTVVEPVETDSKQTTL